MSRRDVPVSTVQHSFSSVMRSRSGFLVWIAAAAVTAYLLCVLVFSLPQIAVLEWRLTDLWAGVWHGRSENQNVAVIGIDEDLFELHEWPLDKDIYGDLIAFLEDAGARAIVFDILFSDNLYACGKGDTLLIGMLDYFPRAALAFGAITGQGGGGGTVGSTARLPERFAAGPGTNELYRAGRLITPYPEMLEVARYLGFVNIAPPYPDGVDRRTPLFVEKDSLLFSSLGLVGALMHQGGGSVHWDRGARRVTVAERSVQVDGFGHLYPDFTSQIPFHALSDVRRAHARILRGEEDSAWLKKFYGRTVFVGSSAPSLGDLGSNPVSALEFGGRSPNVMLHARTAASILDRNELVVHGRHAAFITSATVVLILALLFSFTPFQVAFSIFILVSAMLAGGSAALFYRGTVLPVVEPLMSGGLMVLFASMGVYAKKDADRRFLYETFGKYISSDVIEEMASRNVNPMLGGQEVEGSAFFSDIEGFSTLSEGMPAGELITLLNEYFSEMTTILLKNQGTLDKFIGDAIVAFFGAPSPSPSHAVQACTTAVSMQETLASLRQKWCLRPEVPVQMQNLRMRIGINSGNFVVGNMGCEKRMNYTMLGDTVNLASRLEGVAKEYGVYTVVGEATKNAAGSQFLFRKLDVVNVRGRSRNEPIYQLMGKLRSGDEAIAKLIETYERGLKEYVESNFEQAGKIFTKSLLLERHADHLNPSRVMLKRVDQRLKGGS